MKVFISNSSGEQIMRNKRTFALLAMRLLATIAVSALMTGQAAFALACAQQPAADKIDFPASPVGKLARAFIEAINSGDKTAQLSFINSGFSEAALKRNPAGVYLDDFQKLYSQSGGFDVMAILPSTNPNEIRLQLRTRRGNHWVRMLTRLDQGAPDKLDGFGFRRILDPAEEKADAWSEAKMSEAEAVKEIERHVERAASQDRFSGVVLVSKGDKIVFNKAYGMAEKGFCAPNKLDTKFNLGSMNKMFTSVAIGQMVEAGKLSYDDKLIKVLPDYPNKQAAEKITVHQLLTHTSGLGDYFSPEFFQNREKYKNPQDYLPVFGNRALLFEPGTSWRYSNFGFVVLGAIVEKLSGKNYFDYVRDHIFAPTGMKDTASYAMDEVVANLAVGYTRFGGDDPLGIEARRANFMSLPWRGSPAGGGYSTAPDLFKFSQALRKNKLMKAELTEKITSGKVDSAFGSKYGYGFDTGEINGKSVRGHSGGAPGINSDLQMFWDGSYTVIVMGNYDPPAAQDLAGKISAFLARQ
jgi:CubicO group peptidase (beta-lactamase class C family)